MQDMVSDGPRSTPKTLVGRTARRRTAVAAAVMAAFMVVLPGVASASTGQAGSRAQAAGAANAVTPAIEALPRTAQADNQPFQADCGIATCTVRFSRDATRNARDGSAAVGLFAAACGFVASAPGAIACGLVAFPAAGGVAILANRYYESGDCLGIRFGLPPVPPVAIPVKVKHGTYNCR